MEGGGENLKNEKQISRKQQFLRLISAIFKLELLNEKPYKEDG